MVGGGGVMPEVAIQATKKEPQKRPSSADVGSVRTFLQTRGATAAQANEATGSWATMKDRREMAERVAAWCRELPKSKT